MRGVRQQVNGRDVRARRLMASIRDVLTKDWNPIGFPGLPEDEYDAHIGGVYRLLASGAAEQAVADHLANLEAENMGLRRPSATDLLPVARKLLSLGVKLVDGPAA
jgi:hypothetical protein